MDDGTRDRASGKTARNWSRKDDIRAGSVSGPWRSTPRAAAGQPAHRAADVAFPGRHDTPAAVVPAHAIAGSGEAMPPRADPRPASQPEPASAARRMTPWIGAGALVAVLVVAAVLLWPGEDQPPAAAPVAGEAVASVAPAVVAAGNGAPAGTEPTLDPEAAPRADPALAQVGTVRLRIGPGVSGERRDTLVAALKAAGIPQVVVESLSFRVATSRIGYYHDVDLPAAEALARAISPAIGPGSTIGVRDYGELADPQPGRLDLWIGG